MHIPVTRVVAAVTYSVSVYIFACVHLQHAHTGEYCLLTWCSLLTYGRILIYSIPPTNTQPLPLPTTATTYTTATTNHQPLQPPISLQPPTTNHCNHLYHRKRQQVRKYLSGCVTFSLACFLWCLVWVALSTTTGNRFNLEVRTVA